MTSLKVKTNLEEKTDFGKMLAQVIHSFCLHDICGHYPV